MKIGQILLVATFSVGMGIGQLLLKYAADRQGSSVHEPMFVRLFKLLTDWTFLLGAGSYALMLIYWIWLLSFIPLSRAYPFTFLSIIVAVSGGAYFFNEPVSPRLVVGLLIIGAGLLVMGTE